MELKYKEKELAGTRDLALCSNYSKELFGCFQRKLKAVEVWHFHRLWSSISATELSLSFSSPRVRRCLLKTLKILENL